MTAKIAIIAGGGRLPEMLIQNCLDQVQDFVVIIFKGQPAPDVTLPKANLVQLPLGAVGKTVSTMKEAGVQEVIMAGNLEKPSLFDLKPDIKGAKFLASLASHHDDALLTSICGFLEKEGFSVVAPHDVFPDLLAKEGLYGDVKPSDADLADMKAGFKAIEALGALDIGQAAIVKDKVVLGVEGVEGTDGLIERCAAHRGKKNKGGILVKSTKPNQDERVDMPTVGPETINLLQNYGYKGLAIKAGKTLVVDAERMVKTADHAKIFIIGVK